MTSKSKQRVKPRKNDLWVELVYEHDEKVPASGEAEFVVDEVVEEGHY